MSVAGNVLLYSAIVAAGFHGTNSDGEHNIDVAYATAIAESDGKRTAQSANPSGGINRGPWQIDSRSHPEVTDACAYSYRCSAKWVYTHTRNGADWAQWETHVPSSARYYKNYMKSAVGVSGTTNLAKGTVSKDTVGNAIEDALFPGKALLEDAGVNGIGITSPLKGIDLIGDVLNKLTLESTWLDVAKVAGGLAAGAIGINVISKALFNVSPVEVAKNTTKKVAEVAAVVPK